MAIIEKQQNTRNHCSRKRMQQSKKRKVIFLDFEKKTLKSVKNVKVMRCKV